MPHRLAISSASLGQARAGHALEHRLDAVRGCGFSAIALCFDDIAFVAQLLPDDQPDGTHSPTSVAVAYAQDNPGNPVNARDSAQDNAPDAPVSADTPPRLLRAAAVVRALCAARGLAVACLQPFRQLEGLRSRLARAHRLRQLRLWCRVAAVLGTDLVLVTASDLGDDDSDSALVSDLRAAADIARPVRLAYAANPAAARVASWDRAWALVQRAARPNLGLALDVVAAAGPPRPNVFAAAADPSSDRAWADALQTTLHRLAAVDPAQLFFVAVADRSVKSDDRRPFYGEAGPERGEGEAKAEAEGEIGAEGAVGSAAPAVRAVAVAALRVLDPAHGWVGFQAAVRRMTDGDEDVPDEMAARAAVAWKQLLEDVDKGPQEVIWAPRVPRAQLRRPASRASRESLLGTILRWLLGR